MAAEPGDQELQDKELANNEVESAEISEYEAEKLAANEEDIIDEVWLPLINKGEISADVLHSEKLSANDKYVDNIDSTSDCLQVPVTLKDEVLWLAGLGKSSHSEQTRICCYCDVHLCIDEDGKCFMKYHTDVQYWL